MAQSLVCTCSTCGQDIPDEVGLKVTSSLSKVSESERFRAVRKAPGAREILVSDDVELEEANLGGFFFRSETQSAKLLRRISFHRVRDLKSDLVSRLLIEGS